MEWDIRGGVQHKVRLDLDLHKENERLRHLARVIFTLQTWEEGGKRPKHASLYTVLGERLFNVWKQYALTLNPFGDLSDDVARELGYACTDACSSGKKAEIEAYHQGSRVVCDLLDYWRREDEHLGHLRKT